MEHQKEQQEKPKENWKQTHQECLDILNAEGEKMEKQTRKYLVDYQKMAEKNPEEMNKQDERRVNLYQASGQTEDVWKGEEMTKEQAQATLAIKKLELAVKQIEYVKDKQAGVNLLLTIVSHIPNGYRVTNAAVDTLARLGAEGEQGIQHLCKVDFIPKNIQARAAMALCRFGHPSTESKSVIRNVLQDLTVSPHPEELMLAIELTGVIGGEEGKQALEKAFVSVQKVTQNDTASRTRLESDYISTRLTLDPSYRQELEKNPQRFWTSKHGIVFGISEGKPSIFETHKEKLEKIAEAVWCCNQAFGSEPIQYIYLNQTENKNENGGWTQNSLYEVTWVLSHPLISDKILSQTNGHEACERWQDKGFIDAKMEQEYLLMMGQNYPQSFLPKFRLHKRFPILANAGHPWDGVGEYLAEVGSIAYVDETAANQLFDKEKDKPALQAIEAFKKRVAKFKEKQTA